MMTNPTKKFEWILQNGLKGKLSDTYQAFNDLLGIEIDEEQPDLEKMVVTTLGRELTQQEIFKLRPIIVEIYSYYYGEE